MKQNHLPVGHLFVMQRVGGRAVCAIACSVHRHLFPLSSIGPLREVQLELVLLHVVLPTLLEHSNTKAALLKMVQVWIRVAARVL